MQFGLRKDYALVAGVLAFLTGCGDGGNFTAVKFPAPPLVIPPTPPAPGGNGATDNGGTPAPVEEEPADEAPVEPPTDMPVVEMPVDPPADMPLDETPLDETPVEPPAAPEEKGLFDLPENPFDIIDDSGNPVPPDSNDGLPTDGTPNLDNLVNNGGGAGIGAVPNGVTTCVWRPPMFFVSIKEFLALSVLRSGFEFPQAGEILASRAQRDQAASLLIPKSAISIRLKLIHTEFHSFPNQAGQESCS